MSKIVQKKKGWINMTPALAILNGEEDTPFSEVGGNFSL